MPTGISNEKYRRPSISFQDLLRKGAGGAFRERGEYSAFMFRAIVLAVDTVGGKLETPTGKPHEADGNVWEEIPEGGFLPQEVVDFDGQVLASYEIYPTKGPVNPPNSIKARIISNNMDQFIADDDLRCYWPLFPSGQANVSPGEMVYVVFEDESYTHGLWVSKVATSSPNQTANQILKSQILQAAKVSPNKDLFFDSKRPPEGSKRADGTLIRDSRRLSKLFL